MCSFAVPPSEPVKLVLEFLKTNDLLGSPPDRNAISRITAGITILCKLDDLRCMWSKTRIKAFCIVVQTNGHGGYEVHARMQHLSVSDVLDQVPKM